MGSEMCIRDRGRTIGRGKGNAAMCTSVRSNAVELEFATNAEHLKFMSVVFSDGTPWQPVVIMPNFMHKFRIRASNDKKETLHDYLLPVKHVVHQSPSSMTKEYFGQWV